MLFWLEGGGGRVVLHTVTGGLIAEATGGEFATGAAAAGLQQVLSLSLDDWADGDAAGTAPPAHNSPVSSAPPAPTGVRHIAHRQKLIAEPASAEAGPPSGCRALAA